MSSTARLGLFLFAALLMLGAGVFLIGQKQFLFHRTYPLNAEFRNASGLLQGAPVRVAGLRKGTVKHILLPDRADGAIRVEMKMDAATRAVIRKDSKASISAEGLVGDRFVEIAMGTDKGEPIHDGDTLRGEAAIELADVMKKFDGVMDSARGAVENAAVAVNSLKSISAKIDTGQGTVGALINDRTVYRNVNAGAVALQENMEALKHNFLTRGFFKNRGYDDSTELTKNAVPQLPKDAPSRKFEFDAAKVFDKPDTAKLKNRKALDEVGRFLEANSFGAVVVSAYAGMKGDSAETLTLTQAQAMVVRDYLAENFRIDDRRVRTLGLGKTSRIPEGNQLEIYVYPSGTKLVSARAEIVRRP
jgi:phospholipid/cholesterol/gamma-HCH transport system substrate-binding protein